MTAQEKAFRAARAALKAAIPDPLFRLSYGKGRYAVIVSAQVNSPATVLTMTSVDPMNAVEGAVGFYKEARQLCAIRDNTAPTHADIMEAMGMLSGDDDEPDDYPTVELTQEEFDALPTNHSFPFMSGDVWRCPRIDNPPLPEGSPVRWFRVTVTNRQTGTGEWSRLFETISIVEKNGESSD
jgi:hypothetical protein